eukprot:265544_1
MAPSFCFAVWIISAFCMLRIFINIMNTDSYHSQPPLVNTNDKCAPLFITGIYKKMRTKFKHRGFNIECTEYEIEKLFRRKTWKPPFKSEFDVMCFKYNRTNVNANLFCNGGELVHRDRHYWMTDTAHIVNKPSLHRMLVR